MEVGLISLSDLTVNPHTGRPVGALDRLDATLAYARAADELGLDAFMLGEHHSHKFAVASPAVEMAREGVPLIVIQRQLGHTKRRDHLDLSPRHRQHRDHRHRPRPPRADGPRRSLARALTPRPAAGTLATSSPPTLAEVAGHQPGGERLPESSMHRKAAIHAA